MLLSFCRSLSTPVRISYQSVRFGCLETSTSASLWRPLSVLPIRGLDQTKVKSRNMATGKHQTSALAASSLFDLSGMTAIVTGGGTGIGLMITQALVANGAKVYITGRRKEVLEETVKRYTAQGEDGGDEGQVKGSMHALPGDVSDKQDVVRLVGEIEKLEGKGLHLLVNNAGIARDQETQFSKAGQPDMEDPKSISEHFMKTDVQAWLDTMQTNVTAGYYTSMAFLPLLAKGGKNPPSHLPGYTSQIVNVSSISGAMKGSSGGQFSYAASKAAFTHVSRMLATTFSSIPVRVNVIAPGVFPSEMTTDDSGEDNKSKLDEENASNPAGRFGHDSDMAATILFLAGKGGLFYNDQILYPDGGTTLTQPAYK